MGEVSDYLSSSELMTDFARVVALLVFAMVFPVATVWLTPYNVSWEATSYPVVSWLSAATCYQGWQMYKRQVAIAEREAAFDRVLTEAGLQVQVLPGPRRRRVYLAGGMALTTQFLFLWRLGSGASPMIAFFLDVLWYAVLAGAGLFWGNRVTVLFAITLDTVLVVIFIPMFIPPWYLQPPASLIIGPSIGVFLALTFGEFIKAAQNSTSSRKLFYLLLEELALIEKELLAGRSEKVCTPIWTSAVSSGKLLDIGEDAVGRLYDAYAAIADFNDHQNMYRRTECITEIRKVPKRRKRDAGQRGLF